MDFPPSVAFMDPAAATERYNQLFTECRAFVNMDKVARLGNLCVEKAETEFYEILESAVAMSNVLTGLPPNQLDVEQLRNEAEKKSGLIGAAQVIDDAFAGGTPSESDEFKVSRYPCIELPLADQINHFVHKFLLIKLSDRFVPAKIYTQLFNGFRNEVKMDEVARLGNLCVDANAADEFFRQLDKSEASRLLMRLPLNLQTLKLVRNEAAKSCGFVDTTELVDKILSEKMPSAADQARLKDTLKSDPSKGALPFAEQVDYMVHRFLFYALLYCTS